MAWNGEHHVFMIETYLEIGGSIIAKQWSSHYIVTSCGRADYSLWEKLNWKILFVMKLQQNQVQWLVEHCRTLGWKGMN